MLREAHQGWTAADSSELYDVQRWGNGYFSINDRGHLQVHPGRDPAQQIDIKELVDRLQLRGVDLPVLLRFDGILQDRLLAIRDAFQRAIDDHDYQGRYICVYPIKVNQQRHVVQRIVEHGRPLGYGLEAGSKPELLAVVALTDSHVPIICNGFKDDEFIEMAMLAQRIGRQVIPVVERRSELDLILKKAAAVGVRPTIGTRVKLAARGSGRWQQSGGHRSKFGLTVVELLDVLQHLESLGMADCLQLLHFHLGSQITNIRPVKAALIEAARIYCDLHHRGAGLKYLDVGGGLGVDYDGSQTNFESSINYTLQEYANDVISHVDVVCREADVPHPVIISESGRAIAAYHSALIVPVLGVSEKPEDWEEERAEAPDKHVPAPLTMLREALSGLTRRNMLETYHDAAQSFDMALNLFSLGHMPLDDRCQSEHLYWTICRRIQAMTAELEDVPEELRGLDALLADTYFCNFSLFQSMPDSWAIKQLFPVMPVHRLDEQPTRHAVLGDITCDSDGKIDQFIDHRDVRRTLPLHPFDGSPYYLGIFLIGAYQEILGDLHNLFGDPNAVHVSLSDTNEVVLDAIIKGETVAEVLGYVQFSKDMLTTRLQTAVETAVRKGRIDHTEAGRFIKFYEDGLNGYTYLEEPRD
jgi:arginine decarboxylase